MFLIADCAQDDCEEGSVGELETRTRGTKSLPESWRTMKMIVERLALLGL